MKYLFYSTLAVVAMMSCQSPKENTTETSAQDSIAAPAPPPVKLTLKWETDSVLTTSESVIYDKDNDVLYVSNINGAPDGKDGNGFISKVSLDGKVTELQWVKKLDAPKGLGLFNGKLFVTDIDRIHEIDVKSGKITKTHKVDGAKFLNDITVDTTGRVFASDSGTGEIILIENGKLSKWVQGLNGPNGLLIENGTMLAALWAGNSLQSIDVASKQITLKTDSVMEADGIEAIGDGSYFISSWGGMVHHIDTNSKLFTLIDSRADSINAADIEYIQEIQLLLVPTFMHNTVRAYEVSK